MWAMGYGLRALGREPWALGLSAEASPLEAQEKCSRQQRAKNRESEECMTEAENSSGTMEEIRETRTNFELQSCLSTLTKCFCNKFLVCVFSYSTSVSDNRFFSLRCLRSHLSLGVWDGHAESEP